VINLHNHYLDLFIDIADHKFLVHVQNFKTSSIKDFSYYMHVHKTRGRCVTFNMFHKGGLSIPIVNPRVSTGRAGGEVFVGDVGFRLEVSC
jgi:hypothetical protein